jgi:hypothetical protein
MHKVHKASHYEDLNASISSVAQHICVPTRDIPLLQESEQRQLYVKTVYKWISFALLIASLHVRCAKCILRYAAIWPWSSLVGTNLLNKGNSGMDKKQFVFYKL